MLTRSKTNLKRERLKSTLRERCHAGELAAGQPVPSVRDLATEFDLSRDVVTDLLRELVSEGVLYTVPRVGTFAGRPAGNQEQTYVMVHGPDPLQATTGQMVRMAFEERINELGGIAMLLEIQTALALQKSGQLPPISGVLDYSYFQDGESEWIRNTTQPDLPRVCYGVWSLDHPRTDFLAMDDVRGGRQATQHLLDRGYRKIAFLGYCPPTMDASMWRWSQDREAGWRDALEAAGLSPKGLVFHPMRQVELHDSSGIQQVTRPAVEALLNRGDIDAVVAANDLVAHCLLQGLHASNTPRENWPAIVGFDGIAEVSGQLLTSLRMPWTEIGAAAADLLWTRANVQMDRKPQLRRFPMRLITRLSCRTNWSHEAGFATLTAVQAV
jgi:DNA-binding transcriptional regulator YhcF (GntR family)